ncbi:MAG: hypothetical protein ACRELG_16205 [Gemmataceae bacterium]
MPDLIPDLWPEDVQPLTVLTPLAILRFQAGQLRQRTNGLLEAEVQSSERVDSRMQHSFDLIAPALNRYRYRLFTVDHEQQMVYPVRVDFPEQESVEDPPRGGRSLKLPASDWATTQDEFLKEIARILQSPRVRSVIHSLLARSNEVQGNAPSS